MPTGPLNSDIEIDPEGKPKPKVTKQLFNKYDSTKFDSKRTSISNLLRNSNRASALGRTGINKKFKDLIKTSKIMKDQKVATWDDLLYVDVSTGLINQPSAPVRGIFGWVEVKKMKKLQSKIFIKTNFDRPSPATKNTLPSSQTKPSTTTSSQNITSKLINRSGSDQTDTAST